MIETRLDEMLTMLRRGDILGDVAFASVDLQDALNVRWADESYRYGYQKELEARWRILPIHADLRGIFDDLKTESYARAKHQFEAVSNPKDRDSASIHELSTRIKYEIAEIAMSRATEYPTPWHDALWESYSRNEIPMIAAEPILKPILQKEHVG